MKRKIFDDKCRSFKKRKYSKISKWEQHEDEETSYNENAIDSSSESEVEQRDAISELLATFNSECQPVRQKKYKENKKEQMVKRKNGGVNCVQLKGENVVKYSNKSDDEFQGTNGDVDEEELKIESNEDDQCEENSNEELCSDDNEELELEGEDKIEEIEIELDEEDAQSEFEEEEQVESEEDAETQVDHEVDEESNVENEESEVEDEEESHMKDKDDVESNAADEEESNASDEEESNASDEELCSDDDEELELEGEDKVEEIEIELENEDEEDAQSEFEEEGQVESEEDAESQVDHEVDNESNVENEESEVEDEEESHMKNKDDVKSNAADEEESNASDEEESHGEDEGDVGSHIEEENDEDESQGEDDESLVVDEKELQVEEESDIENEEESYLVEDEDESHLENGTKLHAKEERESQVEIEEEEESLFEDNEEEEEQFENEENSEVEYENDIEEEELAESEEVGDSSQDSYGEEESENSEVDDSSKLFNQKNSNKKSKFENLDEELECEAGSETDNFSLHFERNLGKSNGEQVEDGSKWWPNFINWKSLGRLKVDVPKIETSKPRLLLLDVEEDVALPPIGIVPKQPDKQFNLLDCNIRKQLLENSSKKTNFTSLQKEIYSIINQYLDFFYPEASFERWDKIRAVYCLHCVNHVLKTRRKIIRHSSKMSKNKKEVICYRDQGYTRPKVLILLPFKHSAYKVVNLIIKLLSGEVKNGKRFEEEFRPPDEVAKRKFDRPKDFEETFAGDINEDFKIGLKITKKCLKLYSDFYESDLIIASPLGLRYTLETAKDSSDADYLSSIEILVLDQADVFLMQNWEHVLLIMEALNRPPHDIQKLNVDLMRIRKWSLDNLASLYRQTLVFAATTTDFNRALANKCKNFAGKVQVLNLVSVGSMSQITVNAEMILHAVKGGSTTPNADAQFAYFTQTLLPQLRSGQYGYTMMYVPDYCDYIRLVRYLKEDGGSSISTINEYMIEENSKVAKARCNFFEGKRQFLIYTERFHFYRRYKIKGAQHIVFYGLPTYPHFFSEICNLLAPEFQNPRSPPLLGPHTVTVLFQPSDVTKLVGVLGSQKTAEIINSDKTIHLCTIGR